MTIERFRVFRAIVRNRRTQIRTRRTYPACEMANGAIADAGDVNVWHTDVKSTFDNVTDLTGAVLARGALPVVLGGDHSVACTIVNPVNRPECRTASIGH